MSNSNPKRNWFSNLFSSLSTSGPGDLNSSTCGLSFKKSASKLSDITKASDQDCFRITDNSNTRTPSLSKFISLQRLDSVGGAESEPNRFSYPPSKGETDFYLMGNTLHPSFLLKGLPECHRSKISPSEMNSQTFLGNSISQVSNYLVSTIHSFSERVSTRVLYPTGLPTSSSDLVQRETSFPMRDSQDIKKSDAQLKLSQLSHDVKPFSSSTVTCARASVAAPNVKKLASIKSDLSMCVSTSCVDTNTTIQKFPSDKNCSEKNTSGKDSTSNNSTSFNDSTDMLKPSYIDCSAKPLCTSCHVENNYCQNACAASSDMCLRDNNDFTDDKSEICADDCCSEISFASSKSTDGFSDRSASTDDEWSDSECSFDDETDSEGCQWERLTSCRTPWTCGQYRKRNTSRKNNNLSSLSLHKTTSERSLAEDVFSASDHKPKPGKRRSFGFHPVDESQLKEPVTRPSCLNSSISFILGWSSDNDGYDSDDEDSSSWCHDNEDCWFVSSGEPRAVSENSSCCQSDRCEVGDGASSTSSCNDSCRLWEYFANSHNPLSNIASTITEVCPSSRRRDTESKKSVNSSQTETKTYNSQAENSFYKSPSKVRFSENVTVHHMIMWSFAYREARKGVWDRMALDRDRFKGRIATLEKEIDWCLQPSHRQKMRLYIAT